MADGARIWRVTSDDSLSEIAPSSLNREERIEKWLMQDVSIIDPSKPGLLVIGRQVRTAFDNFIDILCIDSNGDLVIVELKRDKTPREVTSQALDYASWVKHLGSAEIEEIATSRFRSADAFKQTFTKLFNTPYPRTINSDHSILIVASEVDDSTKRIIRYLSEKSVNINFVRFQMFRSEDDIELLLRTFTVPLEQAEQNARMGGRTKRSSPLKTLQIRLDECTNVAEREFLKERLDDPSQEMDPRKTMLNFRILNKLRFRAKVRVSHVQIVQLGRFEGDEEFWRKQLSSPDQVAPRGNSSKLVFRLTTKSDFLSFVSIAHAEAQQFNWAAVNQDDDENFDGEDAE